MPPACFLNAPTDSHASDIGHWLGMTRRGDVGIAPYKAISKARRGEGTPPYGVLLAVCVGRPALRPPHRQMYLYPSLVPTLRQRHNI